MKKEVKFLGIDIGGAHIKLIGLNKKRSVCFANYRKCYVWKGLNNLKKESINRLQKLANIIK